jgi:hypothetical protein
MFSNGDGTAEDDLGLKKSTFQLWADADAKAVVMDGVTRLVGRGVAELRPLTSGDIELKLHSGEIFHLGEVAVTRVK